MVVEFIRPWWRVRVGAIVLGGVMALTACSSPVSTPGNLVGTIRVDGSSTVYPITEAVAEEFMKLHHRVRPTVGISGTGGGFKKLCAGESDISDASRPIKPSEVELCLKNGIEYIELPVAYDGLAVMVHPTNDWVDYLTVDELRGIWRPESPIKRWSDIRPGWPEKDIFLVGADTDSGTFDYFTKAIVGREGASRSDYTWSSDDNVLVEAIAGERHSLGYFALAYYLANRDKLQAVPIDGGDGPVPLSVETVGDASYQPLSRPVFIYVRKESTERLEVQEFVSFYLTQGPIYVDEVGFVPLPERAYQLVMERFEKRVTGSVFGGEGSQVGVTVEELLAGEGR
ncbi:MAG: PstS family phosphate ABC transporter substrate-binding protein [Dehalococcoidia bacterium]